MFDIPDQSGIYSIINEQWLSAIAKSGMSMSNEPVSTETPRLTVQTTVRTRSTTSAITNPLMSQPLGDTPIQLGIYLFYYSKNFFFLFFFF